MKTINRMTPKANAFDSSLSERRLGNKVMSVGSQSPVSLEGVSVENAVFKLTILILL